MLFAHGDADLFPGVVIDAAPQQGQHFTGRLTGSEYNKDEPEFLFIRRVGGCQRFDGCNRSGRNTCLFFAREFLGQAFGIADLGVMGEGLQPVGAAAFMVPGFGCLLHQLLFGSKGKRLHQRRYPCIRSAATEQLLCRHLFFQCIEFL